MASGDQTRRRSLATLLVAAVAAGLGACGEDPPQRDAAGAIQTPGESRLLALRKGDCIANMRTRLEDPDGGHNGVPKVTAVPCSQPHDGEILLVTTIGDGEWPGFPIVDGEAARGREALRERLERVEDATGSQLRVLTFRPTQERWDFEDQKRIFYVLLYPERRREPAPA